MAKKAICSLGSRRELVWAAAGTALLCLFPAIAAPAFADAPAAASAQGEGASARALAQWRSAAERGDANAEFELGRLYEFGAAGLKQSYKRADYWYRKAAAAGNAEAEYRLALIWTAGSEDFPPDLVEALKWAALAAGGKGAWSSLATDLERQIESVTSPRQRAEAEQRAAAWRAGLATPSRVPATAAPPPPIPPAEAPLDRLKAAVAQIDCAALRIAATSDSDTLVLSGTVPKIADRAELAGLAARLVPGRQAELRLAIVPPPVCRPLAAFNALRSAGLLRQAGLGLELAQGGDRLHQGDPIKLVIRGPAYPAALRIDYFSLDGNVLHLWPNPADPTPRITSGESQLFWDAGGGKTWDAGGAPFGTELITALATATPIDLGPRPQAESAAGYLHRLEEALRRAPSLKNAPNLLATLLVKTGPRQPSASGSARAP